jgi:GntR family transcriptional repressor for pyruvate dehydrogenase complex
MIFQKIKNPKLAEAVIKQIENLILQGVLRPGDQLPAERELAQHLDVSRPSLRDAIKELETRGLLKGASKNPLDWLLHGRFIGSLRAPA